MPLDKRLPKAVPAKEQIQSSSPDIQWGKVLRKALLYEMADEQQDQIP